MCTPTEDYVRIVTHIRWFTCSILYYYISSTGENTWLYCATYQRGTYRPRRYSECWSRKTKNKTIGLNSWQWRKCTHEQMEIEPLLLNQSRRFAHRRETQTSPIHLAERWFLVLVGNVSFRFSARHYIFPFSSDDLRAAEMCCGETNVSAVYQKRTIIIIISAGFRNVEEALGPSLVMAPFFNHKYLLLVRYKCIWRIICIYYIIIYWKIIFYSKVRLNKFNYVE